MFDLVKKGYRAVANRYNALMLAIVSLVASQGAFAQSADPGATITSGLSSAATTVGAILIIFAGVWVLYTLYSLITKRKSA